MALVPYRRKVVSCGNLHEAPARLNNLAGPASPLLALFFTVSHNTAVADPQMKATFQPAQVLVDPNAADRLIGPGNTGYVTALLQLAAAVDLVEKNPTAAFDPTAFAPVLQASSAAGIAAQQAAQNFNVDQNLHTASGIPLVRTLLVGITTRELGIIPNVHCIIAPIQT